METGNNNPQQQPQQQYDQPQYAQPQYAQQPYGQPAPTPIYLTEVGKMYLQSSAKWAKNLAVCFVIMLILMLIMFIIAMISLGKVGHAASSYGYYGASSASSAANTIMIVIYLIVVGIYIYPITRLFGFKKFTDNALASNDSNLLAEAHHKLDGFFKYVGILSIIGIVFMVFYLIVMAVAMNHASSFL